jgi:hypothetical protein
MRMQGAFFSLALALGAISTVGLPHGSVQAAATQETFVSDSPVTFQVLACNGDVATVEGVLHVVAHLTTDAKGGSHFATSGSFSDIVGTGASGTVYHLTGGTFQTSTEGSVLEFSSGVIFNFVSTGPSGNFKVFSIVHGTFNANGQLAAEVFRSTVSC